MWFLKSAMKKGSRKDAKKVENVVLGGSRARKGIAREHQNHHSTYLRAGNVYSDTTMPLTIQTLPHFLIISTLG